jgi:hypothetical protein
MRSRLLVGCALCGLLALAGCAEAPAPQAPSYLRVTRQDWLRWRAKQTDFAWHLSYLDWMRCGLEEDAVDASRPSPNDSPSARRRRLVVLVFFRRSVDSSITERVWEIDEGDWFSRDVDTVRLEFAKIGYNARFVGDGVPLGVFVGLPGCSVSEATSAVRPPGSQQQTQPVAALGLWCDGQQAAVSMDVAADYAFTSTSYRSLSPTFTDALKSPDGGGTLAAFYSGYFDGPTR